MILPHQQILAWAQNGGVEPFDPDNIGPASIDLRIGSEYRDLSHPDTVYLKDTIELWPSQAFLATTIEQVALPSDIAGVLYLRSSWARQGLDHILAGFVDPGFCGQLTMELHAHRPVSIPVGTRVVQMVLYSLTEPTEKPYSGRYQNQAGPTGAR